MAIELDAGGLSTAIAHGGVVLVLWYSPSLAPWKALAAVYDDAAARHPHALFAQIDVAREPVLARRCGIAALPTLMAFRDGALAVVRVGLHVAESLDLFVHALLSASTRKFSAETGESPEPTRSSKPVQ